MRAAVVILAVLPVLALASRGDPTRSSSGSEFAEVEHVRKLIVGGSTAAINDYPWAVSLQTTAGSVFCSGALISPGTVITAVCALPCAPLLPSRRYPSSPAPKPHGHVLSPVITSGMACTAAGTLPVQGLAYPGLLLRHQRGPGGPPPPAV
mmetsp:Transcript_5855/g.19947  ORF Transcript_5855/g.19947 Transcript_5855/m.19947 type:complete len:151 (+) Transcript_5855:451-903(+)